MEQTKHATVEYVAEGVGKLVGVFYKTPESLFEALVKILVFHKFTESEVDDIIWDAIYRIKKTELTIADVLNGREKSKVAYI